MSRGRAGARLLRSAAALITLLVLLAGLPVLLYSLGGSPLPSHVPDWQHLGHLLLRRDNGAIFLAAVRDISWLAWAAFTVAVLAEVQAALRGRAAPRLRLGGLQSAAGHLVTLALLSFGGPTVVLLAGQPAATAAVAPMPPASAAPVQAGPAPATPAPAATPQSGPDQSAPAHLAAAIPVEAGTGHEPGSAVSQVMSMSFSQLITVRPGDCLWTIAQRYLGDGDRYPEIVRLNQGHDMGDGHPFTDPSVIMPGWVLQLPAAGAGHSAAGQRHSGPNGHGPHPSREQRFRRPHPAASPARDPAASPARESAATQARGPATSPARDSAARAAAAPSAALAPRPAPVDGLAPPASPPAIVTAVSGNGAGNGAGTGAAAASVLTDSQRIPPAAVFAAGMLAGGAAVTLARMRHRQRQSRRPGRRIPLPVSAPVLAAERRLRAETQRQAEEAQAAPALRAALAGLGSGLAAAGQPIPEITAVHVSPDWMDVLLASPASEAPPEPFTVPGGRHGLAWRLPLPLPAAAPLRSLAAGAADLLPGLFTVGATHDGYLLLDLEYLRVTTVEGPGDLADRVLTTAAAELGSSELAGWYELILVGFPELAAAGGRATRCDALDEALDLLAVKAVALERRLGRAAAEVRQQRLAAPDDEDWALTLLVSRVAPTPGQFALLLDLCGDPAGMAALIPGGADAPAGHPVPASVELASDPAQAAGMRARIWPLGLEAWPQPLDDADYEALASMFASAALEHDVAADEPPYDGSSWPPCQAPALADLEQSGDLDATAWPEPDTWPEPDAWQEEATGEDELPHSPGPGPGAGQADDRGDDQEQGQEQQPSLRIGVLGTFTINGSPAALLPAQSQLVLALALNGQDGLSNQQLRYLLGADPDHPRASDSLRQLIVRTRRQLGRLPDGREWIEHRGSGQYALHPAARFDWAEFDQLANAGLQDRDAAALRSALRLIRGQPFSGCYYWWLDPALTETVRAQIVDGAELLAELELAAGDSAAAARAARTGLAGDTGAEQLWRALMQAEHAAGNLTGVRDAWSRCLDAIAEIAADGQPHPRTAALYRELLAAPDPRPVWSRG